MGKRSKTSMKNDIDHNAQETEKTMHSAKKKNRRRKNKKVPKTSMDKTSNELMNEIDIMTEQGYKEFKVESTTEQAENKVIANTNKNTKFINDVPHEVPTNSGRTHNVKKRKGYLNEDEDEIKDEDIDKFCDGLNEDDNVVYENWVKLIEANFHKKQDKD